MLYRLITLSLFLLTTASICHAQSGWLPQNSGTSADLYGVYFINTNSGFAMGDGGTLIRTTNDGITWAAIPLGVTTDLHDIDFGNNLHGCIVGDSTTIFATDDGGTTWTQRTPHRDLKKPVNFLDVDFYNGDVGAASGANNIFTTTNGGKDWVARVPNTSRSFVSVAVPGPDTLIAAELRSAKESPVIFRLINGIAGGNYGGRPLRVFFLDNHYGWCLGLLSRDIDHTRDGGHSWESIAYDSWTQYDIGRAQLPLMKNIFFTDTLFSWGLADSGIIYHSQGQRDDWHFQYSGTSANLRALYFTDRSNGWIVGDRGTILHTPDGGVSAPANMLLIDGFEGSIDRWTIQDRWNDGARWEHSLDAGSAHTGNGSMTNTTGRGRWEGLATPIPPGALATLSFWMKADNSPEVTDFVNSKFEVQVSTAGPSDTAFHEAPATYMNFPTEWTLFHADLSLFTGQRIWVRWLFRQEKTMTVNLDDVILSAFDKGGPPAAVPYEGKAPAARSLFTIYPSPAAAEATIEYVLDAPSRVRGSIINSYGNEVTRIIDADEKTGTVRHHVDLHGLPAGVLLLQVADRQPN